MPNDFTEVGELTQTEFDSSIATLMRINWDLLKCKRASFEEDRHGYFKHLKNLRRESYPKMKDSKGSATRKECDEKFNKLSNLIELFERKPNDKMLIRSLDKELDAFELFLRDFMDSKGMLMRDGQDARFALSRR